MEVFGFFNPNQPFYFKLLKITDNKIFVNLLIKQKSITKIIIVTCDFKLFLTL